MSQPEALRAELAKPEENQLFEATRVAQHRYLALIKAATMLLCEVDSNLDSKPSPQKFGLPFAALVNLRNAIQCLPSTADAELAKPSPRLTDADWQPIETAPKGVEILMVSKGEPFLGDWGRYCKYNNPKFTHWMPLPPPPIVRRVRGEGV